MSKPPQVEDDYRAPTVAHAPRILSHACHMAFVIPPASPEDNALTSLPHASDESVPVSTSPFPASFSRHATSRKTSKVERRRERRAGGADTHSLWSQGSRATRPES